MEISLEQSFDRVYGLGIDTGGTFTDAAVVDLRTHKILAKAKARTTHHDLSIGLGEAVDNVLRAFNAERFDPSLVGVSTTLATNSILEGKGGQVGLIGLGWKPEDGWELGARVQRFLPGGHDARGNSQAPLDIDVVESTVREMASQIDSVVVSALFSVHNPYHEMHVRRMVREKFGLPVVMGHELTAELGIHERTVTAVLNARLIPVLSDFLRKVQGIMAQRMVEAPIMVFKGDGTLMNIGTAIERPVDTILSGPAASAMGGRLLTGLQDCVVVDIGGTSTDIAILESGFPKVTREGATVGRWRTRVEAVDMWTSALGGDSEVRAVANPHGLAIGPERVAPLCFAVLQFPEVLEKMRRLRQARFLMAVPLGGHNLSSSERRIVRYLEENGPSTLSELRSDLEDIILLDSMIKSLKGRGVIAGIGLTPTDVLHALGVYTTGDVGAARLGVELFAGVMRQEPEELMQEVMDIMTARVADEVLKKLLLDEVGTLPDSHAFQDVVDLASGKRRGRSVTLKAQVNRPVVGLGAPAGVFVGPLRDRLHVEVIVPEDHDVGNAVGAVGGEVSEFVDVFVFPRDKGYGVYSAFSTPISFELEGDAVQKAKAIAGENARLKAESAGGLDLRVEFKLEEERIITADEPGKRKLAQMRVRARAVGKAVEV